MSNATMPSFKDEKGNIFTVRAIGFIDETDAIKCEIVAVRDGRYHIFHIYSDGNFILAPRQSLNESIPEKSAFYNAVMAMFNLED